MADPQALVIAKAAADSYERVGSPEGDIILAEAIVYLATAPKSNRSYLALKAAREAVAGNRTAEVPLHLRNPVTGLMKEMGYGGYDYPFDHPGHFSIQEYLPESLRSADFYRPSIFGHEKEVAKRLEWWRSRMHQETPSEPGVSEEGEDRTGR